jgi:hypothetical protein
VDGSPEKSETMEVLGQDPVRCKIIVDNKCLQQVKILNISVVKISYEDGEDIQQKLAKFAQITGIVDNTFKLI